tara:strand:+ start:682 stop:1263 length:582 start_codon:yes stop_codon:yes gene_type:complete
MPHNRNHKAFDMMKNATRGNMLKRKSPMMSTREMPGSDQMYLGNPNVDPGAGQAQIGPGFSAGDQYLSDFYGPEGPAGYLGVSNMNDLYDHYIGNDSLQSIYGSFTDMINAMQGSSGNFGGEIGFMGPSGTIGGAGDLGFGNMFLGGMTGTEYFPNDPDTSIIDPTVDQQCLAAYQTYGQEYSSYEEFANAMC